MNQPATIPHFDVPEGKKVYFISDVHLGTPDANSSRVRETLLVDWLTEISIDAAALFIVGDLFDFWYEYRKAVPKGYVRVLGKLAELRDKELPIYFFFFFYDKWRWDYMHRLLGIPVLKKEQQTIINGKKFFIAHGDGLGPGDHGYKFIKKIFTNPFFQWCFRWVHPDVGITIAEFWSRRSRYANGPVLEHYLGDDKEWLVQFSQSVLQKEHFDYLIFGHRHLALDITFPSGSRYLNLGDWLNYYTYAVFDGQDIQLLSYRDADPSLDVLVRKLGS